VQPAEYVTRALVFPGVKHLSAKSLRVEAHGLMKAEYGRETTAAFVRAWYTLRGPSVQPELHFSPACRDDFVSLWSLSSHQEEFSLVFEMCWATVPWNVSAQKQGLLS